MYCALHRPGGLEITKAALEVCSFEAGARLADIGCGAGETVAFLTEKGFDAQGVDFDPEAISLARTNAPDCIFILADAVEMPFADASLDGVFFECSFSKIQHPKKGFDEASRVLKHGGRIIVSDFFSKNAGKTFSAALGRVENRRKIASRLADSGFGLIDFTDCSEKSRELFGQMIFDSGMETVRKMLGCISLKELSGCGYGLFVAEKMN